MTRLALARTTAVALVLVLGTAAWGAGIFQRFFDYDEIYHAHATWLIANGQTPFHDFLGSHSPLLWYPLAGLWSVLPETPSTMLPLRVVAAVGTLCSIVAITACIAAARRDLAPAWLILGMAIIAFDPRVLDFSLEFRPDSWATALLFGGFLLWLTARPTSALWRSATFAAIASLAVLASPKFFLLPIIFAILDLVSRLRREQGARAALFGYALGVGAGTLVALAVVWSAGIDPGLAIDLVVKYQWTSARHSAFSGGLLERIVTAPLLAILVAGGVISWVAYLRLMRRRPSSYEVAVLIFLAAQFVIIDRPYKRSYAPWFLLAASFVPFIGAAVERRWPRAAASCFAVAVLGASWGAWGAWRTFAVHNQAAGLLAFADTVVRLTPPDGAIVTFPPFHPVVRRDVFYAWNRTTDPGGYGTEAIMRTLDVPGYSDRFQSEYYRRELAANPPALVVVPLAGDSAYEPAQWAVLQAYLDAHRQEYSLIDRDILRPIWVRRR